MIKLDRATAQTIDTSPVTQERADAAWETILREQIKRHPQMLFNRK